MLSKSYSSINKAFKYIDESPIISGSFSDVYQVIDIPSGKVYMKKVFNTDFISDILKEISINKKISNNNSPYIIEYIGSNIEDLNENGDAEEIYMISEFPSKGQLINYMKCSIYGFNDQICKLIIYKVLKALEKMHQNGIFHGNINPQNIWLDGERYQIKLGDFSFSEFFYSESSEKSYFQGKKGKEQYMAPEMLLHHKKYDGVKTDIFSIGVLLFVLRTLKIPFSIDEVKHSGTIKGKLYGFIKDKNIPRYWNELNQLYQTQFNKEINLDPQFKDLFIKMIAYNPAERPTIEEIFNHPYMAEVFHANQEQFLLYENNLIEELNKIDL